jgi:hypothetical protein
VGRVYVIALQYFLKGGAGRVSILTFLTLREGFIALSLVIAVFQAPSPLL